jgi:hypothetical protein
MPREAVFDADLCKVALKKKGLYKCGGNIFWADALWTPLPGVPVRQSAVEEIKAHYFSEPCPFPSMVVIGVPSKDENPMDHRGSMKRVSPEEMVHALMFRIASEIEGGATQRRLQDWRRMSLSVSFHFKLLESDDARFWESARLREHLVVDFATMARTAVQRVFELVAFKSKVERTSGKISNSELSRRYKTNLQLAKDSEDITENYVDNAMQVFRGVLGVPMVVSLISQADEIHGHKSPFNSVLKLYLIAKKVREWIVGTPLQYNTSLQWTFTTILDWIKAGFIERTDIGTRLIKGEGSGGRGIIDLIMLKYRMQLFLTTTFLADRKLPLIVKQKVVEVFQSHQSYRSFCGFPPLDSNVDLTWQAGWEMPSLQVVRLIEDRQLLAMGAGDRTCHKLRRACLVHSLVLFFLAVSFCAYFSPPGAGDRVRQRVRRAAEVGHAEREESSRGDPGAAKHR